MAASITRIILKFKPLQGDTRRVDLTGPEGEDYSGTFALPCDPTTWPATLEALEERLGL